MGLRELLRPYAAAFASRFLQMLQYRTAAFAGFATQCWWGGIKVMVFAAFYGGATASGASTSMSLAQAVTYTWLAQGLLVLLPPYAAAFAWRFLQMRQFRTAAFAGVVDIPARLYFGLLGGPQALAALGLQCAWIALLVALGHRFMGRTMRRLEVQGG